MLKSTICLLMITLLNSSGIVLSNPTSTNSSLSSENYYDGTLTMSSPSFVRPRGMSSSIYYYQAIKLTVYTSGTYTLTSSGSLDTYGLLYDTFFDRYYPQSAHLVAYDDDSAGGGQFRISYYLQNGKTYILVVTTSSAYTTGNFKVIASGVGTSSLTTYLPSTVTLSGYLSSSKPSFSRPNSYSSSYYYDTYDITVSTTGSYSIRSSSSSSLDTYGCLYRNNFYPSSPLINQMTCNDDYQSGDRQFLLTGDLYLSTKYILVVTTSFTRSTGSYSVAVTGPSLVSMSYSTQGPIYISPTIGGIIGAVSFLILAVIIFTIVACRRRRLAIYRQTPVVAQYNPNLPNVSYPGVHQPPYGAPPPAYNPYVGSYKS